MYSAPAVDAPTPNYESDTEDAGHPAAMSGKLAGCAHSISLCVSIYAPVTLGLRYAERTDLRITLRYASYNFIRYRF